MESSSQIYRWEHSPSVLLSSSVDQPGFPLSESESDLTHHAHRNLRSPPLNVLPTTISRSNTNLSAISSSSQSSCNSNTSQDVPLSLNNSAATNKSSTASRNGSESPNTPPVNSLAAHYGIPQFLPRPPRITPRSVAKPVAMVPDFESLSRNYLSMLANKPSDNSVPDTNMSISNEQVEMPPPAEPQAEDQVAAIQAAVDHILGIRYQQASPYLADLNELASPEFSISNDFLSSPFINTPYDDFNTSPMDDSPFVADLQTPVMDAIDEFNGWMASAGDEPLFSDNASALYDMLEPATKAAPVTTTAEILNNKDLLMMSPPTPMLDSVQSLYPSPRLPTIIEPAPGPSKPATAASVPRKVMISSAIATGTRRNITPDNLVPLDAPTQTRRYVIPSSTSRKEVPASFAKKRSRSDAFGDDEQDEEVCGEAPGPDATDLERIEYKRRLSTVAARKSRRRKLEYKLMLETRVDELEKDSEKWRTRCRVLQEVLRSHSVDFRFDDDE
ncbi:hypothetical protein D9757_002508 [Collybiopsis confluens]|uniref:BZIP domain-containing protein n=1 Tax=Collybiopsis confluens TaxID=2823264 RepID=A0A8H5HY26_9AGAR|nr:hypothetical protein D9757_002508 [Collybiopsis confluens]